MSFDADTFSIVFGCYIVLMIVCIIFRKPIVNFLTAKRIVLPDPINCPTYKKTGCSHVDGYLCNYPNCIDIKKVESDKKKRCGCNK